MFQSSPLLRVCSPDTHNERIFKESEMNESSTRDSSRFFVFICHNIVGRIHLNFLDMVVSIEPLEKETKHSCKDDPQ